VTEQNRYVVFVRQPVASLPFIPALFSVAAADLRGGNDFGVIAFRFIRD